VNVTLETLKEELEAFGAAHDAGTGDRSRRMLNVTRDTGEFLLVLARATAAARILEIGTSNGYSTLWLAEAVEAVHGAVTTVELCVDKVKLAARNIARSGFSSLVMQVHEDAGRFLERSGDDAYDLIFLDSERSQYVGWWPDLRRVLSPGGLLVTDNATSHPDEIEPLIELVSADPAFTACLVPVGKGEYMATKATY
jgi:predicted O-methyltransferase YrrM